MKAYLYDCRFGVVGSATLDAKTREAALSEVSGMNLELILKGIDTGITWWSLLSKGA